ncbi:MAG: MBL fold metallo-hydrolase [Acidobacteria bacterium]|nr:MBL fold metallo-hydrolase [Acidobacteriota bacterium]
MADSFDRRTALRAIFMGAVGAASRKAFGGPWPQDTARVFRWEQLGDGYAGFGAGGNILLWPTSFGAVLVDTKHNGMGASLKREVTALAGEVAAVVVTHHHADHAGGIPTFVDDVPVHAQRRGVGRRIVAGRELKAAFTDGQPPELDRWSADLPSGAADMVRVDLANFARRIQRLDVQSFAANVTFTTDDELDVGNDVVQMHHAGRGHTDNDAWVRLPEANVIHAGDLIFNGFHPFVDVDAGATTVGWQHALSEIAAACDSATVVVPGHGAVTDQAGVQAQWGYFEALRTAVENAIAAGMSRAEVTALTPDVHRGLGGTRGPDNLGIVFDELGG